MKQISKSDFMEQVDFYADEMRAGKIFIYPTDTLFGIGCDATNEEAVSKIFQIKKRDAKKSLLFIAPSLQWIADNCSLNILAKKQMLEKLPGPYSFIVNLKNRDAVSDNLSQHGDTVGVRVPRGWFNGVVSYFGRPFVSTSVNFSGEPAAVQISDIPKAILEQVDYVVSSDGDVLSGNSSKVIDVTGEQPIVLRK
ncbi:L-threonylcarbamoyladenylate synthase [Candidatus Gracilibacteria bacterium]|nr:L-threonylcarbamoyladenylate synthase [Candidatus Gracilibacteria bacterium]